MLDGLGGFAPFDAFPPGSERTGTHARSAPKSRASKPEPEPEPFRWVTTACWHARYADAIDVPGPHTRQEGRDEDGQPVIGRNGKVRKRVVWEPGTDVNRLAMFGAWDLTAADHKVMVVEGEKVAEHLTAAGIPALGIYGWAYTPTDAALECLRDCVVVLSSDNDDEGRKAMRTLAHRLAGIAALIRWVEPPADAPKGWDLADVPPDLVHETIRPCLTSYGPGPAPPDLDEDGPPPEPKPRSMEHLSRQSLAALRFAQAVGDRVRFDHGRHAWLIWSGHRWRLDRNAEIRRIWLGVLAERYTAALRIEDGDRRTRTLEAIQTAGATDAAIESGLRIAASYEPIAMAGDEWDPDPWLLGCENGIVDLRTGQLRDGRPEDLITRSTALDYDPAATCARWDRFLVEVFPDDPELWAGSGGSSGHRSWGRPRRCSRSITAAATTASRSGSGPSAARWPVTTASRSGSRRSSTRSARRGRHLAT